MAQDRVAQLTRNFAEGHASDVAGDMSRLERQGAWLDNRAWLTCLMLLFTSKGWRKLPAERKAINFGRLEEIAEARSLTEAWRVANSTAILNPGGNDGEDDQ